jgi:lysophospholipase L1-like esterase
MTAAVAAAASFLWLWTAAGGQEAPRRPTAARPAAVRLRAAAPGSGVAACEQQLEGNQLRHVPRLVIVGASFTAGVGSGPAESWAVLLARHLHWDAVVYGVPGAGYVRAGAGHEGPVAAEVASLGLRALNPSLIIVQAGHDDIGVAPGLERQRVEQAVALIQAAAPRARIAMLTVFARRSPPPAAYQTDRAIVQAAQAADHMAVIIDPLTAGWVFPRAPDGLHPTAAGSAWIASQVAGILGDHGVRPAVTGVGQRPIICDRTYAAGGYGTGMAGVASRARAGTEATEASSSRIRVPPPGGDSASTAAPWLSAT